MQAGDDVLVLADPDETPALERYFTDPVPPKRPKATQGPPSAAAGPDFELIVCRWWARVTALMHDRVSSGSRAAPNSPRSCNFGPDPEPVVLVLLVGCRTR